MKILFVEPPIETTDREGIQILRSVGDIKVAADTSEESLIGEAGDADALIVRSAKITRRIIEGAKKLKAVASLRVGVDNIDVKAATERGVFVINPPGANADSVADHTFALILVLARNLLRLDSGLRCGNWGVRDMMLPYNIELHGKTLGVIGFGAIGRRVSTRAKAFQMKIVAYDPYLPRERFDAEGVEIVDLETLLSRSDVVTIHIPLTEETYHMISEKELRQMKRTAFLINTSRGGIVDDETLVRALQEGWIAGAGLDVFEREPIPLGNPLLELRNVVVTPHSAALAREARARTMVTLAQDIVRALSGEAPQNLVNRDVRRRTEIAP